MNRLSFTILAALLYFLLLPLPGAEKTLKNAFTALFSGRNNAFEYFAPEFRKVEENGRIRKLAEIKEKYKKLAPLLRLAYETNQSGNDTEILKALLRYLGQDPALAENLPPEGAEKIRALLPVLQKKLQILYRSCSSIEVKDVKISGSTASGLLSCYMEGKTNFFRVKLVKRNHKWLILEAAEVSKKKDVKK